MSASERQEFCVRWNSHLGSIGNAMPQLLAGQRFVDVTLVCESHQLHCHRLVLAACSSYFESILAENPCKHPVIILPSEIKLWEIHALVDFMYRGEVTVTQTGLPQLLRCAEQLRIRGLYGSDAALNLHQLKALNHKTMTVAATAPVAVGMGSGTNDSTETDDTTTNSTITTTTTASVLQQQQQQQQQTQPLPQQQEQQLQQDQQLLVAPQLMALTAAAAAAAAAEQQQQQANGIAKQQQQQQLQLQEQHLPNSFRTAGTEDDSADDSLTSNAFEQYANASTAATLGSGKNASLMHLDSTIEEDHNYVAQHDEDDSSYADTELNDVSNNSSLLLQNSIDANAASLKRVRRSEESLAQAAKCVSKGQTFQNVSNMYNIPVSTIRFYMARKGILPKRKRGRGAAATGSGGAMQANVGLMNAMMSQIEHIKRSSSPLTELEAKGYQHAMLLGIKAQTSDVATNLL